MNIVVVVVAAMIVLCVLAALKSKLPAKAAGLSFDSMGPLFTPAERSFLGVLEQVLDNRYRVFGKVRLGDLVKPAKGLSKSQRTTASNKVRQKHVDFVICSATDLAVIGAVELDDQSHGREDRSTRDAFVDQALATAKIPIAHFSAKKGYAIQEVRTTLYSAFKISALPATPITLKEDPAAVQTNPETKTNQPPKTYVEIGPVCSKCTSAMVKRQAKTGPNAGKFFWACSGYPKCRQVIAIGQTN